MDTPSLSAITRARVRVSPSVHLSVRSSPLPIPSSRSPSLPLSRSLACILRMHGDPKQFDPCTAWQRIAHSYDDDGCNCRRRSRRSASEEEAAWESEGQKLSLRPTARSIKRGGARERGQRASRLRCWHGRRSHTYDHDCRETRPIPSKGTNRLGKALQDSDPTFPRGCRSEMAG